MMLSNIDLLHAIKNGSLAVEPFFEQCIRPAGLLLTLGSTLLKPQPGKVVDVLNKVVPDYDEIRISKEHPYAIAPGEFLLAHTDELVTVGQNLGFFIEGRSTLARVGLTIVQTAMIVYPGHSKRAITLELANHGVNSVLLYPRMKIARAAVFELKTPSPEKYDEEGKYRVQSLVGPPIFDNEFVDD